MDLSLLNEIIIYDASDITAGGLLIVLAVMIIRKRQGRTELYRLLASVLMILSGIIIRVVARSMHLVPEYIQRGNRTGYGDVFIETAVWILVYVLVAAGISESVEHIIHLHNSDSTEGVRQRHTLIAIVITIGIIVFACTDHIPVLTAATLIQFLATILYLRFRYPGEISREFESASAPAIISYALGMFYSPIRVTGIGLSAMLFILNEQYHARIRQELAEREADLAKSKVQLLADQISPHYVYNSLQSIRGLCGTDPEKAKAALDAFSEYLRANLEKLTEEELIPFARELEHTQAYLDLEKLAGNRSFDVEYSLDTMDFMLPPLVLQPLVENAVKHGSMTGAGNTTIGIVTRECGDNIYIEVSDRHERRSDKESAEKEASGNSGRSRKGRAVGLENIRTRLAIQSGGTLETESTDEGTKATIIIPKITSNTL